MSENVIGALVDLLQLLFFLIASYYLGIAVFSLFPVRESGHQEGQLRFAVVIPAHNESAVLGSLLNSLRQQDYPQEAFSVFVMADHCTDHTAQTASKMGARVLYPDKTANCGKGYVLADAFAQILNRAEDFDAIAVIDADNIADPRFLAEINDSMLHGCQAVQGYIDAKNPNDSWLSHAYAMWYWITNRISQMGCSRLGMGCRLGGTGFALSCGLLREIPWETGSLAEDAEYTLKLALADVRIAYAHKAVVYDEKPNSFRASVRQRCRWAQGITAVQRDYTGRLIRSGKWSALFRFWSDLLMPLCFILFLFMDIFAVLNLCQITSAKFADFWTQPFDLILLNLYLFGMIFTVCCGLVQDKKCNSKLILNLFGFMIYMLSWIPAGLFGILRHTKKDWYHTEHKHSV